MLDMVDPIVPPRKDTRGLPEGFDPQMFYEYRIKTLAAEAKGIESFAYKYIPWKYLKSFAFAIDPVGPFKVAPFSITPYNRTRVKATDSVTLQRTLHKLWIVTGQSQIPNWGGQLVCWSAFGVPSRSVNQDARILLSSQAPVPNYMDDTTSRTRLIGSKQGTMRFFKSYINSPGRSVQQVNSYKQYVDWGFNWPECSAVGGVTQVYRTSEDTRIDAFSPTSATFPSDTLSAFRDTEYAYLESLISQNAIPMLKDWSPNRRSYTLFRNIVELRDIPKSIVSLQKTLIDLKSLFSSISNSKLRETIFSLKEVAKDIPNEYLSYHFGWKQTYKDIKELLALPEAMSKKYEFLVRRAGKPTTFRVKRDFTSSLSEGLPAFVYDGSPLEFDVNQTTRMERITQVRLVINSTFDFPPPNLISFRSSSFFDRIGLVPRPTDLYNLTPWTWLLDWFTGLGNYVELIDNMARDDSLINWGMFTAKTSGRLITSRRSSVDNATSIQIGFDSTVTQHNIVGLNHESVLNYECQIRKDAANALAVKTIAGLNLSAYQLSILGALLAQRKAMFIPKS
ncbi:TPA_asm: maturation protein [ssRNA phage Esthiorhiza.1_2]|uniref:Maturation protein n=2 Tax=Leviviricetes TaxID=2842243 RepID=A0A8S5L3K1_9VIRU|nr:maturation protein [ssRNA phage Esthiorhiza.1_2]DAD51959.1 TPA_asm: maturation protein [ssRNA phage Esthiorhiza.1_2]